MVALASAASHSRGRNLSLPLGDTQEVSQRLSGTCPSLMRARCSRWWRDSTLGAGGRRCQKPPRIRPRSARACEDGERQRPGGDLEGPHHSDGGHVPAELAAWVRARLRTCPRSTLLSPMRPRHTKMGGWVASSTSATQGQGLSDAAPFAPPPPRSLAYLRDGRHASSTKAASLVAAPASRSQRVAGRDIHMRTMSEISR